MSRRRNLSETGVQGREKQFLVKRRPCSAERLAGRSSGPSRTPADSSSLSTWVPVRYPGKVKKAWAHMADYLPGTISPSSLDCRTLILSGGKHAQGSGPSLWPQEMEHGWSKPTKLILYTFTSFLFKGKHVTKFWPMRWRGKTAGGREPFVNDPTP